MAIVALHAGLQMKVRHLLAQDGRYYYQRRVPDDLKDRVGKVKITIPLKTVDPVKAAAEVKQLALAHDSLWRAMRGDESLAPADLQEAARRMLLDAGLEEGVGLDHPVVYDFVDQLVEADRDRGLNAVERQAYNGLKKRLPLLLSQGLKLYLGNHRKGADAAFVKRQQADWNRLVEIVGDIAVDTFTREHAKQVRDALLATGMRTTTVRRRVNVFRAVFAAIRRETESIRVNPFEALEIVGLGKDAKKREVFTEAELEKVVGHCREVDDERRRLITLLMFTGMRLSEALGLVVEDLRLDHPTPHLIVRPHPWRSLKTPSSERMIPLVGDALLACAALKRDAKRAFCFPAYASVDGVKANAASATLNKWIKSVIDNPRTCHEFRHTMRDRLRHAGAPKDFIDAIGGWSKDSIGENYGLGHALKAKADFLAKAYRDLTV